MQWSWHIFIYCSLGTSRIWWFWSRFAEARSSFEWKTHSHLLWYSAQCMKKRTLNEMKRTGTSANAIPLQPATVYYKVTCHTLTHITMIKYCWKCSHLLAIPWHLSVPVFLVDPEYDHKTKPTHLECTNRQIQIRRWLFDLSDHT